MRSPGLAAVLASLLACSPGDPGTGATTGTTGTTGGSSTTDAISTSTGSPTSSGSSTTSTSTSGSSTSSTSVTTAATTTTSGTTTDDTTSAGATETGTGTASTDGTGGVVPIQCAAVKNDYGPCEAELGWAFDGVECTVRSGCDCAPDCDKMFPDAAACALACAAAGNCNEDRVKAAALAMDPIQEGTFCDGVYVCPGDMPELQQSFEQVFGMLSCEPGNYPCDIGLVCAGLWQGALGPEEWQQVCAASLLPMSGQIYCVVFGP